MSQGILPTDYDLAAQIAAQICNTLSANKDPKAILFGRILALCLWGLDQSRLRQFEALTSISEN